MGIPKGSLENSTINLFKKSGWQIRIGSRSYFPTVDDEELSCYLMRAQEMSRYVESGVLDGGITGSDWIRENNSQIVVIQDLIYSRTTFRPTRWVLVVPEGSSVRKPEDLEGKKIATELVNFTRNYFARKKITVDIEFSWGATEAKVVEGLVDAIVEVTETGSTLKAHNLRIVEELMTANPQLIANNDSWEEPWKREKMKQISMLLQGALQAEAMVGLKMNIPEEKLENIIKILPSLTAPTISNLYQKGWLSVEIVAAEKIVKEVIPKLKNEGAKGIVEYPLNKLIF